MKVSELYPERWLRPAHLGTATPTVRITHTRIDQIWNPRARTHEAKIVLTFSRARKEMILNKTQALAIVSITGSDDTDDWIGFDVVLSVGRAPNGQPTVIVSPIGEEDFSESEEPALAREELAAEA